MKTAGSDLTTSIARLLSAAALTLLLAVFPQWTWAQSGPQVPRSQAPFKSQMLSPVPRAAEFDAKKWHSAFSITPASIYAADFDVHGDLIQLDYYSIEYRFEFHYTPHPDWQFGTSLGYRTSDDAGLDQATLSFHKAFGFGQNGRELIGKDRYLAHFPNGTMQLEDFSNRLLSRQYEISAGYHWLNWLQHQATTTFSAQYHDDALFKRQGKPWDLALQLDYGYQFRSHQVTLMSAYSHVGADRLFYVPVRQNYWHGAIGYRYWFNAQHRLSLDYLASEGVGSGIGDVGGSVHEINLGYRYQHEVWGVDFVIMQNTINADSSADIAFHFRVSHRFHVD